VHLTGPDHGEPFFHTPTAPRSPALRDPAILFAPPARRSGSGSGPLERDVRAEGFGSLRRSLTRFGAASEGRVATRFLCRPSSGLPLHRLEALALCISCVVTREGFPYYLRGILASLLYAEAVVAH
jgi:hypothetical protein